MTKGTRDSKTARKPFVIKWIHTPKNDSLRLKIESILNERNYTPVIIEYGNTSDFLKKLGDDKIDILIVSGQSVNATKFESILNKATKRYPFDVLYYDIKSSLSVKNRLSFYSTVRIKHGKQFIDTLVEMIEENPSKWKAPRFIRGLVLSRGVDMEGVIEQYIVEHLAFNKKLSIPTKKQIQKIMYDYAFAPRTKRLVLEMIMMINGNHNPDILKSIDNGFKSRNRLAHTWLGVNEKDIVVSSHTRDSDTPNHKFDKASLWKTLQDIDRAILYLDSIRANHKRP